LHTYKLLFLEQALNEYKQLIPFIAREFKIHIKRRLFAATIKSEKLDVRMPCYKIKLRHPGYRLVYMVNEEERTVTIVCITYHAYFHLV
jgi:mRNA interferase RelE/StbE